MQRGVSMFLRRWFDLSSMTLLGATLAAGCVIEADPADEAVDTSMAPLLAADAARIIPGQYIVMFRSDLGVHGMEAALDSIVLRSPQSRIEQVYTVIPGFGARLSAEDLAAIRRNPAVAHVEHDQE